MCVTQSSIYSFSFVDRFRFHWLQVSEIQSTLQPGSDVKFIPDPPVLLCAESFVNLPFNIILSNDQSSANILQDSIKNLCSTLLSSVAIVKNKENIPTDTEPLEKIIPKGPTKKTTPTLMVYLHCPLVRITE